MPLPTGTISFNDIRTEYSLTGVLALGSLYAGGGIVASGAGGYNGAIPTSGTISLSHFQGHSAAYVLTEGSSGTTYGHTASIGSISPTTYNSATIVQIATTSVTVKGSTTYTLITAFSGNQSTSFFSSISLAGVSHTMASFTRSYASPNTFFSKSITSAQMMDGSGTPAVVFT
jgi:hypothetical protein